MPRSRAEPTNARRGTLSAWLPAHPEAVVVEGVAAAAAEVGEAEVAVGEEAVVGGATAVTPRRSTRPQARRAFVSRR
jgi:hypothetical protein